MTDYFELMRLHPELFVNSDEDNTITILKDPSDIKEVEKSTNQKTGIIYKDKYIMLLKDAVAFPDNSKGTYIRIMPANGKNGTVILPIINNKILLLKHFRHSLRRFTWELPRGFGENHLSAIENAKKEIYEECGLEPKDCEILGKVNPDSGLLGSEAWIIKALIDESENDSPFINDHEEAINEFKLFSIDEIKSMISQGIITDSFTISAIFLAMIKNSIT